MASRRPSPSSLVLLVVFAGLSVRVLVGAAARGGNEAVPGTPAPCLPGDGEACETSAAPGASATAPLPRAPRLDPDRVCPTAGYLCAGLGGSRVHQVIRWNDDTREIHVRVPTPPGSDLPGARTLQQAAARGIRAWNAHPFPVRVTMSDQPGAEDFAVTWVGAAGSGMRLGEARTEWTHDGERAEMRVAGFTLAYENAFAGRGYRAPREVQLTATHEMGHALGLPHSDEPEDVMFPTSTADRMTARDYRTMETLYALPNGAEIGPPAAGVGRGRPGAGDARPEAGPVRAPVSGRGGR